MTTQVGTQGQPNCSYSAKAVTAASLAASLWINSRMRSPFNPTLLF
ncbi:hypothetical protein [Nostoc sp. FACHB-888]|nr:hypothetical protein [Nostoc sp. FACHB-888]MBD2247883.1 hypothetical protein [Nostoc sp. FACHB-888]